MPKYWLKENVRGNVTCLCGIGLFCRTHCSHSNWSCTYCKIDSLAPAALSVMSSWGRGRWPRLAWRRWSSSFWCWDIVPSVFFNTGPGVWGAGIPLEGTPDSSISASKPSSRSKSVAKVWELRDVGLSIPLTKAWTKPGGNFWASKGSPPCRGKCWWEWSHCNFASSAMIPPWFEMTPVPVRESRLSLTDRPAAHWSNLIRKTPAWSRSHVMAWVFQLDAPSGCSM